MNSDNAGIKIHTHSPYFKTAWMNTFANNDCVSFNNLMYKF